MVEEINNDKKVDILLVALDERYKSLHKIRDRVQSMGIWLLGIMVGISGWLLKGDITLNYFQKIIYIFAIFIAFFAVRYSYLNDLRKGFKNQQQVAVKLEKSLGLFEQSFFVKDEFIYPKSWENVGKENGDGNFFETTYLLIYIGVIFLILSIIANGMFQCSFHELSHIYSYRTIH